MSQDSTSQDVIWQMAARILIADDVPSLRLMLTRTLKNRGHIVLEATSGDQALELLIEHQPDAAILDIVMPGLDGLAVCRAIREHPILQALPVIILSGSGDDEKARRAGADCFIAKPFLPSALLAVVDDLVRNRIHA